MNSIFAVLFLIAAVALTFKSPESLLAAMLEGGEKALLLSLKMVVIYAVWMGFLEIMNASGISSALAKLLKKPLKLLFGEMNDNEQRFVSMNVSANILGMGGAATPPGIQAINSFAERNNTYAMTMLFVLAATSLQILPTSVVSLRAQYGSATPSDIILPTFLSTMISTLTGILLVKIFVKHK